MEFGDRAGWKPALRRLGEAALTAVERDPPGVTRGVLDAVRSPHYSGAPMRVCVIFNPTARGDQARRFRETLEQMATNCLLKPTTAPGAATTLAAEAVREGCDVIVAAGGDGTVSEVVDGLAAEPRGLMQTRLGVVPLGTINVFARELGLPLKLTAAWDTVRCGQERLVDLPQAEFRGRDGPVKRAFAQLAGAGLDSRAIARVDWAWKKKVGPLAYVVAGLEAMRGPRPQILAEGGGHQAAGELVLVGNGRFYGGTIPIFPEADLQDGLLDVRVFPRTDWPALLRFGWSWLWRRFEVPADNVCFRTATLNLSSPESVPFELDGDNVGPLPVRFTIQPQALRVMVP